MSTTILLIGFGSWGEKILNALHLLETSVIVVDKNEDKCKIALEKGAIQVFCELESISQQTFKGVIIATPSTSHFNFVKNCASYKVPLFVEKPLTTSLESARKLQSLDDVDIHVMHIWKYHPGVLLLKKLMDGGELGQISGVKSLRSNWTSPRKDTDTLWNMAIHDLSICETLLGSIQKIKCVSAERHQGHLRGITVLMGNEPYFNFEASNRYPDKNREIRVFGTEGVAILPNESTDTVMVYKGDHRSDPKHLKMEKHRFESTSALILELKAFINYINGGAPPKSDLEEGIRLIAILEEIQKMIWPNPLQRY